MSSLPSREDGTCKLLMEAGSQRSWLLNTLEDSGSTSEPALNFHTQTHLFYLLRTRLESLNDHIFLSTTPQCTCHNEFWDSWSSDTDPLTGSHPVRSRAQMSISLPGISLPCSAFTMVDAAPANFLQFMTRGQSRGFNFPLRELFFSFIFISSVSDLQVYALM